ncbi:MAG TPA: hypothetical protein VHL98_06605 [Microvirga sp.]|jgi:hypothetical protein|nr:hypothetical protein [Microvirga sp.]
MSALDLRDVPVGDEAQTRTRFPFGSGRSPIFERPRAAALDPMIQVREARFF